ncbi:MAG: hypothetical protein GQ554_01695 [Deltaproteobacteria bacterium]|nr:hypothetical protein [Deltaproteobacteria bacterium]
MKKLVSTVCTLFLLSLVIMLSGTSAQAKEEHPKDDPHKKLLETKCQKCHSLERVKEAHLTKETAKETVEKMRKKEGADRSKGEADKIYDYLGEYYIIAPTPPVAPIPIR